MATFEKKLTDEVWHQCLLQYFIKRESQNWGDLGQHQAEQSLAHVMGFRGPTEEFYTTINKRLDELEISNLTLEEAQQKHQYFELKVDESAYSVFEAERINNALQKNNCDLVLQVGYYGAESESILAKGNVETFNGTPV